jgi:hypothetical protein
MRTSLQNMRENINLPNSQMVLTNKQSVLKKLGVPPDTSFSVEELASKAGIPVQALKDVYSRGLGAYSSNLSSVRLQDFSKNPNTRKFPASRRLSAPQWAMARVYSFVNRAPGTFGKADKDIAVKYGIK